MEHLLGESESGFHFSCVSVVTENPLLYTGVSWYTTSWKRLSFCCQTEGCRSAALYIFKFCFKLLNDRGLCFLKKMSGTAFHQNTYLSVKTDKIKIIWKLHLCDTLLLHVQSYGFQKTGLCASSEVCISHQTPTKVASFLLLALWSTQGWLYFRLLIRTPRAKSTPNLHFSFHNFCRKSFFVVVPD